MVENNFSIQLRPQLNDYQIFSILQIRQIRAYMPSNILNNKDKNMLCVVLSVIEARIHENQ